MKFILIILFSLFLALPALAKKDSKPDKQKNLPPGLQKKMEKTGKLPPGWQKKLAKGEILEPQIYHAAVLLPSPPKQSGIKSILGTQLLQIEDRIIRITSDTREILDIIGIPTP